MKMGAIRQLRFFDVLKERPQLSLVLLMFVFMVLFFSWAAISKIDVIVRTEGRIIPAGKAQNIQHLEGGIVRKIHVQEGEFVKAGQELAELSDIEARTNLGQERSRLGALRAKEARLMAESYGYAAVAFPKDLNDEEVKRSEIAAFNARRIRVAEEIRVIRDQSAQKKSEIFEAESRRKSLLAEQEVAQQQFRVIEGLSKNEAASHLELLDSKSRVQKLSTQIAEAESAVPRLRAALSETESRIGEVWARYRSEASSELTQVREELERSSLEVGSNYDRLERNVVKAPVSGIINRMAIATLGGVVKPGETLMEITPADSRVVVEARAKPDDRAHLARGLPAKIRIGAYDYSTYGALDGKVTEVSADTLSDERGSYYYRVMLEMRAQSKQEIRILPGMTAVADVVVGKRTVLSYLLSPLLKFKDRSFRDAR